MFIIRRTILILILQFTVIQMYSHNKPLAEKIWSERCQKNSMLLNDCNWCRCTSKMKYDCKARICEEIDMFGHFKDAIQEIDVGMEGHGSWRTRPQACTPGVHYRRGAVLCVCDEDGNWPNPVCRDLFQILHSVELTGQTRLSKNESCSPTKLYLVGCNVCLCPSSGYLDPKVCTNKECQDDDPVIEANQTPLTNLPPKNSNDIEEDLEIYAMCDPKLKYELGCRSCDCLRNNRLLCGNCSTATDQFPIYLRARSKPKKNRKIRHYPSRLPYKEKINKLDTDSICHDKEPLKAFKVGCNLCHCGKYSKMFCTIRKCIDKTKRLESLFNINNLDKKKRHYREVAQPPDDESCKPGTIFKRDCNTCICGRFVAGVKEIVCTLEYCRPWGKPSIEKWEHWKVMDLQINSCVVGTYYRVHCKICHCFVNDKVYEACRINLMCLNRGVFNLEDNKDQEDPSEDVKAVKSLTGFCEPMRRYKNDCNTCRCMSDGKTIECTSKICSFRSALRSVDDQLSAEIVPVVIEDGEVCPEGHSYKLDCNVCFCLSNGNAICTTTDCSKQNKLITYMGNTDASQNNGLPLNSFEL